MTLRETDADWIILGDDEPFYGVFSQDKFLRRNLTPEALSEFWASGVEEIQHLRRVLIDHFGDFQPGHAVDFGCGVGRLTRALAEVCDRVTGVDVSPGMLAEASRHRLPNIDYTDRLGDQTFDWISSVIVFQHIPPARGYDLFADLLRRLNPGGVISVQFTLFRDAASIMDALSDARTANWDGEVLRVITQKPRAAGEMLMYDYDLGRLMALLVQHDIHQVFLEHTDHNGWHGARIFGRRAL